MADIKLSVDVTDAVNAAKILSQVERNIKNMAGRLASNSITQNTYNKGLQQQNAILRETGVSVSRATTMIHTYSKSLGQAKAAQDAAADMSNWFSAQRRKMQMMKESENIAKRAAQEEARAIREVEIATQQLTREKEQLASKYNPLYAASKLYERSLEEISQAHRLGVLSAAQMTQQIEKLDLEYTQFANNAAQAGNRFEGATGIATQRMSRMGVVTQQAGYQIGDFLVQVQSGQNWMVAFGQQATQLAGTMTIFGGKFLLLGTALGIIIPLVTAVGAMFMRTRQEAREAAEGLTTFEESLKSSRSEATSLAQELERLNRGLRDTAELTFSQGIDQARTTLEEAQNRLAELESRQGADPRAQRSATQGAGRDIEEAREAVRLAQEELDSYVSIRGQVEQINNLQELETALQERQVDLQQARLEALLEAGRIAEEGRQVREGMVNELQNEADLYRTIIQYGNESAQVEALRAEQARLAYEARVRETTTNEVLIQQVMALYTETEQAAQEADKVTAALQAMSSMGLSSLTDQVRVLANMLSVSADEALRLINTLPAGTNYGVPLSMSGEDAVFGGQEGDIPTRRSRGGGSSEKTIEEIIAERQKQVSQEIELMGLMGESRRLREIQIELENAYQGAITETVQAAINGASQKIAAEEQVLRRLEEQRDAYQNISDTIQSSMEQAFMSIIDGTKSASDGFKEMARSIIAELYKVLVVQQLVGSFDSSTGTGTGIVGSIGRIFGLASGGTMQSGQPYLVGEKGPELVMPSRSGTVLNNDLTNKTMGGGSAPVINMVYNFQGGITEADLGRAMPLMVEQTKRAVVDTVQRGGSVARVFK